MTFSPTDPFRPAWGIQSPHAQTVFASFIRSTRTPRTRRERWTTPDGDFVDLDLLEAPAQAPHVLILHGLEGSSRAGYVSAVLRGAHARGWAATALNFRSCSGEPNALARSYHSGEVEDPRWILGKMRAATQGPLYAVGFSLGGNVLLRLLEQVEPLVEAAVAVSPPLDLQVCAHALDGPGAFALLYRERFLRTLKQKALEKARRHPGCLDVNRVRAARSLEAFDDVVTAPLHGFAGAKDYYAQCSSGKALEKIQIPTLLIHALDDPLVPFPRHITGTPNVQLLLTKHGGHVGFVGGTVLQPRFWAEEQALAFLSEHANRGTRGLRE